MNQSKRYITREQMDTLTERILSDFGHDAHSKVLQPVPIEELVEFYFDLQLCWEPIDHLDDGGVVLAALLPLDRRIVLNESRRELFERKPGTYHFTLAHELGHWVLHTRETPYVLRNKESGPEAVLRPAEEVQADLFAGCLLMPSPALVRAVSQLKRMGRIHLSSLYGLAEHLRVTISALTVRMAQLELLTIDRDGIVTSPSPRTNKYEQMALDI
jgi:hypothetical protein